MRTKREEILNRNSKPARNLTRHFKSFKSFSFNSLNLSCKKKKRRKKKSGNCRPRFENFFEIFIREKKKLGEETPQDWIFAPAFNSFSSKRLNDDSIPWKLSYFPPLPWKRERDPNLFASFVVKNIRRRGETKKKKTQNRSSCTRIEEMNWREWRGESENAMCRQKLAPPPGFSSGCKERGGCSGPKFRVSI